jgi:hypothetical protein
LYRLPHAFAVYHLVERHGRAPAGV